MTKVILVFILGVVSAIVLGALVQGCGCNPKNYSIGSGTYVLDTSGANSIANIGSDTDYQVVISIEAKTVHETFTRGGKPEVHDYTLDHEITH